MKILLEPTLTERHGSVQTVVTNASAEMDSLVQQRRLLQSHVRMLLGPTLKGSRGYVQTAVTIVSAEMDS